MNNTGYRKVVWQCNDKYKGKTCCTTPRLTDEEITAAFLKIVNRLAPEREEIIANLGLLQAQSCNTKGLEIEVDGLREVMA